MRQSLFFLYIHVHMHLSIYIYVLFRAQAVLVESNKSSTFCDQEARFDFNFVTLKRAEKCSWKFPSIAGFPYPPRARCAAALEALDALARLCAPAKRCAHPKLCFEASPSSSSSSLASVRSMHFWRQLRNFVEKSFFRRSPLEGWQDPKSHDVK